MEPTPLIEFKGVNGRIELYKNSVVIDRGTVMGFLTQGLKGRKEIYHRNITSIQIKKPGLTAGYIQFSLPGGVESRGGVFSAGTDENTVSFRGGENYDKALKIKEYVEKSMEHFDKPVESGADELEKMFDLMKRGIISQEEFEQKKKKILGI